MLFFADLFCIESINIIFYCLSEPGIDAHHSLLFPKSDIESSSPICELLYFSRLIYGKQNPGIIVDQNRGSNGRNELALLCA